MQNKYKTSASIAVALTVLSSLSSAGANPQEMEDLNARLANLEQSKRMFPSASPRAKHGARLFTAGELLIWQMHEDGIPVAIQTKNGPSATTPIVLFPDLLEKGTIKNINYHWDLGSRLTIGYNWPHDQVDVHLTWLRFFSTAQRSLHAKSGEQLQPVQLHPVDSANQLPGASSAGTPFYAKMGSHAYVHLQQLDLDLGRSFFAGKWFNLRPHFGIRTTWLQQRFSAHYDKNLSFLPNEAGFTPGDTFSVKKKSHWWGIGPEAGFDTRLLLGKGFQLFGNLTAAIEYGFHSLSERDNDTSLEKMGLDSTITDVDDNFRMSRPILDLQLGLGWGHLFGRRGRCHLRIDAGWEQHIYYSQNQFLYFVDDVAIGDFESELGDKTFQGFNVALRLDY